MPFWRKGNRPARMPDLLRLYSDTFLKRALLSSYLITTIAIATVAHPSSGEAQQKPAPKPTATKKANELTLAGLRPGRDTTKRAFRLLGGYLQTDPKDTKNSRDKAEALWMDNCRKLQLTIDLDTEKSIQVMRVTEANWLPGDCDSMSPSPWKTGNGLRVGDAAVKVVQLYGQPDSRSPSTKDGQPLELWYYAFDWAGPDVPQVMEVVCTREKDGQPGRVVEITLAAPSL